MQNCRICWYLSSSSESALQLVHQWIILWKLGKTNRLLKEVNSEMGNLVGFILIEIYHILFEKLKNNSSRERLIFFLKIIENPSKNQICWVVR